MDTQTLKIEWLSGLKVLLLGHYVPAPLAAYLLRQLGAEVIKLEDGLGDHLRYIGQFEHGPRGQQSPMFRTLNAGFRSLGLQYRKPAARPILKALLQHVDIVFDGNRAGALERYLGEELATIAPQLIYVPINAYGQVGPMAGLAGHDNNVLALAGNLSYTQTNAAAKPSLFSAPVADLFAGQTAALSALAAIIARGKLPAGTASGQRIDASMLHAGFFLNLLELSARNDPQENTPQPDRGWMNGGRPDYNSYRCSDGKFVFFGLIESWAAKRLFENLGRKDLIGYLSDPQKLAPALSHMFAEHPQAYWVKIGDSQDACITAIHDLEEACTDPQIKALGRIQQVQDPHFGQLEIPSYPAGFGQNSLAAETPTQAPMLGEHNFEILHDILGLSQTKIDELYVNDLIRKSTPNE